MFRLALRNLFSRKLRFALTALSIVLGTAMISGTYVLTDQITGAFDDIFAKANSGVDVIVTRKQAFSSQQGGVPSAFPEDVVEKVKDVPGVDVAEGLADGNAALVVDGKAAVSTTGAPSLLVSMNTNPQFSALSFVDGVAPRATGQVAIDVDTAAKHDVAVGERVELATETGVTPVTVVGTFKFGESESLAGTTIITAMGSDVQRWMGLQGRITSVVVAASPGVDPAALSTRVQAALGDPNLQAETGAQNADRQAGDIEEGLGFLRTMLLVFAAIAILVGAFVIFNIFSITIAQRIRDMAMLRTVGATRGQLRTSVLLEALIVGVIASLVGIGAGVLLAMGLKELFAMADLGLPTAGIEIRPRTVIVPIIVGVVSTVLAAIIPAVRATRIPPVAALREGAVIPKSRFSRYVPLLGGVSLILGIAITLVGMGMEASVNRKLTVIGLGALLIINGVAMGLRVLIRPLARIVGAPLSAAFGRTATMGRQNTIRDPERTASTATALMIGIALVVFIAVFVSAFKNSFFTAIDRTLIADQVTMTENFSFLPERAVEVAKTADGVETVLGIGTVEAQVNGKFAPLSSIDPAAASRLVRFDWRQGSATALSELGTDGAIVEEGFAKDNNLKLGSTFELTSIDGVTKTFTVRGVNRDPQLFTGITISQEALRTLTEQPQIWLILTKLAPGISLEQGTQSLTSTFAAEVPLAKVRTRAEYKDFVNSTTQQFLSILYVLLALSVLISLVGVVITLYLAVYERTREIGMMRAIGSTRRQIRSMIRFESVITCAIGGTVGMVVGLLLGFVIVRGLSGEGLSFSAPIGTLVLVLVLAVIAGLLAAIFPARRAAKLRPLEALQYE